MSVPAIAVREEWLHEIRANALLCEPLRAQTRKPKTTGTISEAACMYLRHVVERVQPKVCVEIGTFIGTSALVLASAGATVYTCDKDNAAFAGTNRITVFPKTTSTDMLTTLVGRRDLTVDLWFFDGRIQPADLAFIEDFSSQRTVFAFDDYEGKEKGVINVGKLRPWMERVNGPYELIAPPVHVGTLDSRTTIALLAPKGWRW